MFKKGAAAFWK